MKRELDTRESVRTVTSNDFITACGLEKASLKARKLLYLAISQCKKNDRDFFEYNISIPLFAELMEIDPSNIYQEADKLTDELMHGIVRVDLGEGFQKYHFFSKCEYSSEKGISFRLDKEMTDFLLELKGNFSQPLLNDFLRMNSPYSMAIWHLFQREMHSKKPSLTELIEFDITVEELRKVTGCQTKLKQLGQFKERVLDKAIREIEDNCGVVVTYTNIKKGRTVTGFHFSATSQFHIDESTIPQHVKDKAELFNLKQKSKSRELTDAERAEYDRLTANAEQIEMEDYL